MGVFYYVLSFRINTEQDTHKPSTALRRTSAIFHDVITKRADCQSAEARIVLLINALDIRIRDIY